MLVRDGNLQRYPDTRWNARYDKIKEAQAKNLITSRQAEKTIALLDPIIGMLNFVQKDGVSWSGLRSKWNQLLEDVENITVKHILEKHEGKLKNGIFRILNFLESDYALAPADKEWIKTYVPKILPDIEKLEAKKLMDEETGQLADALQLFQGRILAGFPTSEAAVERGFSKHKAIHSKFRAKLENGFVEKVLFIRENSVTTLSADEELIPMEPFDDVIDDE